MDVRNTSMTFKIALMLLIITWNSDIVLSNDIDDYINNLSYSKDQVLAYTGESITSTPKEGNIDGNMNFIVIERRKNSFSNARSNIGVVASNEHRTYPGSLLLANNRLIDNAPDILAVGRAPLTYTVNLPGLTEQGSFTIAPSFSRYQAAVNNVLKTWFEQFPNDHETNAFFQSSHSFAYSKELLRVKFGMEFKNTDIEANIDFSSMNRQEKLIMIHKFQQIFYSVSVGPTYKPSALFAPDVTRQELERKTNSRNPPVMVDSVSYGRTIYVKLETSSTDKQAKFILGTKLTKFDVSSQVEYESTSQLKDLSMTVYVLGGSSDHIELINARTISEVNDVIKSYGKFSRSNLGYPISYSSVFIKDNSVAVIHSSTEYTETSRTEYSKGIIKLIHKGWFVMQWKVTWNELQYDSNGRSYTYEREWYRNMRDITAPFETEIELPGNARDISVFAKECTGLFWEWWRVVIDRSGIPLINYRTFEVWGTTLNPRYEINPSI